LVAWIVVALVGVGVLMAFTMSAYGPSWMAGTWMWMMPLGMVAMALLVALVVVLVVTAVQPRRPPETDDATRILESRYARGELSRDEFLRMRDDLIQR
jgi:putative membrane protein